MIDTLQSVWTNECYSSGRNDRWHKSSHYTRLFKDLLILQFNDTNRFKKIEKKNDRNYIDMETDRTAKRNSCLILTLYVFFSHFNFKIAHDPNTPLGNFSKKNYDNWWFIESMSSNVHQRVYRGGTENTFRRLIKRKLCAHTERDCMENIIIYHLIRGLFWSTAGVPRTHLRMSSIVMSWQDKQQQKQKHNANNNHDNYLKITRLNNRKGENGFRVILTVTMSLNEPQNLLIVDVILLAIWI